MLSIPQLIKALRKLQNNGATSTGVDLVQQKLKHVVAAAAANATTTKATTSTMATVAAEATAAMAPTMMTSLLILNDMTMISPRQQLQSQHHQQQQQKQLQQQQQQHKQLQQQQQEQEQEQEQQLFLANDSSQQQKLPHSQAYKVNCQTSSQRSVSLDSPAIENVSVIAVPEHILADVNLSKTTTTSQTSYNKFAITTTRSQQIQNFYQQHLYFHIQHNQSLYTKQKQSQYNAMSSLAAEPRALKQMDEQTVATTNGQHPTQDANQPNGNSCNGNEQKNSSDKPCFNTGLGQILQFMELIGNLKHTKRTGWVLRDVSDPESISGHMYRMSMMTFLLDGSEGLNQIRCMELALVHDLAESVVGDLTPFCGVSRTDKRAMEFKAMEDICKLIEPRGKRIMELFEEYEIGESAESKFVKDLDRLDMVMQAFEYEKRDNCLLKHQEFFDSTKGKFNHPFVKKLVDEIYEQRQNLARSKGATPPPPVHVPDMDAPNFNGHRIESAAAPADAQKPQTSASS